MFASIFHRKKDCYSTFFDKQKTNFAICAHLNKYINLFSVHVKSYTNKNCAHKKANKMLAFTYFSIFLYFLYFLYFIYTIPPATTITATVEIIQFVTNPAYGSITEASVLSPFP